jgi:hypothetical protein
MTVTGRTRLMFSPAKLIVVGGLALAVGGVLAVVQPFDRQMGTVPAAEGGAQPAAPVAFTGTATESATVSQEPESGSSCQVPATRLEEGVAHTWGSSCGSTYSFSDSRLNGTVTWSSNDDEYTDGSGLVIQSVAMSIENDGGAWRMIPILSATWPDPDLGGMEFDAPEHFFLVGEGGYDGLVAVVDGFRTDDLSGYIIEGELPPDPANAHRGPSSEAR